MPIYDYLTDTDPGACGAGKSWLKTDGTVSIRNTTNAAWVVWGSVDHFMLGNIPKSGGSFTGALTGSHGLAPSEDDANLTGTVKREGISLVDDDELDAMIIALRVELNSMATAGITRNYAQYSVQDHLAFNSGVINKGAQAWEDDEYYSIPVPTFGNNITATPSDCKWTAGFGWFASDQAYNYPIIRLPLAVGSYQALSIDENVPRIAVWWPIFPGLYPTVQDWSMYAKPRCRPKTRASAAQWMIFAKR